MNKVLQKLDNLNQLLSKYNSAKFNLKPNYRLIPCSIIDASKNVEENVAEWNAIVAELVRLKKLHILTTITRTTSGGISYCIKNMTPPMYDFTSSKNMAELTIILGTGMWRIQFRRKEGIEFEDNEGKVSTVTGSKALTYFNKKCKEYDIDLDSYAVSREEGLQAKAEIEAPMIKMQYLNMKFTGVHHIDFHNSYPAGLVNTHPEFYPIVNYYYERRKDKPEYKAVLNYTVGRMQSPYVGYKYATLSRDAINDNNRRIHELANRLEKAGRVILGYNTDGIWYLGEIYHGEGEGKALGEWQNDHINCTFRAKSDGAYEYIENGCYHPVMRGRCKLDKIKDRSLWSWGDIYQPDCEEIVNDFDYDDEGFITLRKDNAHGKETI